MWIYYIQKHSSSNIQYPTYYAIIVPVYCRFASIFYRGVCLLCGGSWFSTTHTFPFCTAFPTDISRTLLVPLGRQAWEIWYLAGSIGHTSRFIRLNMYDTIWCRAWYKGQKCYYQNIYVTWHLISLAGISSFGASAENDPTAGALEFDRDLDKVSLWRALGMKGVPQNPSRSW